MQRETSRSATAVVDATGSATLRIAGPIVAGSRWELRTLVLSSQRVGDGTYPTATVYRSIEAPPYAIGTSRAADQVTFNASGDWLLAGDSLIVVIEQAAPGTIAQCALSAIESGWE